jgi:hypothetical protein
MKEPAMTKVSAAHIATASLSMLLLAATASAQAADQTAPTASASKVRIVRLSEIKGAVSMDRGDGRGLEPAITNMPIVEKSRLQTETGAAEVEFEDNSSLRVAPDSIVEFPKLERMPGGTTVSSVHLVKGMAYVSMVKSPGTEFNLLFGEQSVRLQSLSHVRLKIEGTEAKLAVLDGALRIDGPSGEIDVPRKKTVTFSMAETSEPTVAREVAADPFDSWDHNEAEYHERFAQSNALNGSPYAYGTSDMAYYGSFNDLGGCGTMWQPYFASSAWSPYSNGTWAWYEGAGYSWVSPYPWGWTPYHYGSWNFCPGAGWGWMPGGAWSGLNNNLVAGTNSPVHLPKAPVDGPRVGESSLLAVNEKPLVRSDIASSTSFVFRKDSAGLGVPREELGKLEKFSQHAISKGTVSTDVYFEASPSGRGEPGRELSGVVAMHRGSPPPAPSSASAAFAGSSAQSASSSTTAAPSAPSASHGGSSGGSHH